MVNLYSEGTVKLGLVPIIVSNALILQRIVTDLSVNLYFKSHFFFCRRLNKSKAEKLIRHTAAFQAYFLSANRANIASSRQNKPFVVLQLLSQLTALFIQHCFSHGWYVLKNFA